MNVFEKSGMETMCTPTPLDVDELPKLNLHLIYHMNNFMNVDVSMAT